MNSEKVKVEITHGKVLLSRIGDQERWAVTGDVIELSPKDAAICIEAKTARVFSGARSGTGASAK